MFRFLLLLLVLSVLLALMVVVVSGLRLGVLQVVLMFCVGCCLACEATCVVLSMPRAVQFQICAIENVKCAGAPGISMFSGMRLHSIHNFSPD